MSSESLSFNYSIHINENANKRVNQTAGSSVALVAVKFSGRRWLPLALGEKIKNTPKQIATSNAKQKAIPTNMTNAYRITGAIFGAIAALLFHYSQTQLGFIFGIISIGAFLLSLFSLRKDEIKKVEDETKIDKEKMLSEARKAYERKDAKKLLETIDSFNIPEKYKHEIYNIVVLERKKPGGTVKSNPYKNE